MANPDKIVKISTYNHKKAMTPSIEQHTEKSIDLNMIQSMIPIDIEILPHVSQIVVLQS